MPNLAITRHAIRMPAYERALDLEEAGARDLRLRPHRAGDLSFRAQGDIVHSATIAAGGALNLTATVGPITNG